MKYHLEAIVSVAAAAAGSIESLNAILQTMAFIVAIGSGTLSIATYLKNGRKKRG